jgi:flagellar biosynthesis/type III secretory pathway chaperone
MAAVTNLNDTRQALSLSAVLEAEHSTLRQFLSLLEREQMELASPRPEALERLAGEKQVLMNELETLVRQRPHLQASSLPEPLRRTLGNITEAVGQARRLNDVNGRLLALHGKACAARVQVLTAGAHRNQVYGTGKPNPYAAV